MSDAKVGLSLLFSDSVFVGMSECESYGMTWGCDEDCLVYQRGECQNEDALEQLGPTEMDD